MAIMVIKNIEVSYGKAQVLHGISLNIEEKEITTLLGPNGAGKTTLLRAISGLIPYKGTIQFMGRPLDKFSTRHIVENGLIHCPEGRLLFPEMTVMENLEMGAFLRRDKRSIQKDLHWIFSFFPVLSERKSQMAGTLSGGEQQMVSIARAYMSNPRLLMLDEPSFGLAPLVKEAIFEMIQKIAELGKTILLVEQDVFLALRVGTYFYVLEVGEIVFDGNRNSLLDNQSLKNIYLGIS